MGSPARAGALLLVAGLAAAGCNRGPAEEARAEAERTLEANRTHIERFAPERLLDLEGSLEEARAALAEGRYTEALRVAQEIPGRIHDAVEVAKRRELAATLASPPRPAPDDVAPPPTP